jgi:catechol 2,3-dioxygenase-like lactoylglutathione lyase family enzyme
MPLQLDHLIVAVNDRARSIEFYTGVLGFAYEGERAPFAIIRVTPDLVLQLAPWGTRGGDHLAFSMTGSEFEALFRRIRESGVEFGDAFNTVGSMRGPGEADGARGSGKAVYLFDPSQHLVEIRHYEPA